MHRSVCNSFHESAMNLTLAENGSTINYVGHGYFRYVWAIFKPPDKGSDFENLIMDQLTASPGA
jgi:hypothetical protein